MEGNLILTFSKKIGNALTADLLPGYLAKCLRASPTDSAIELRSALSKMPHGQMICPESTQELILLALIENKQPWLVHIIEYQENVLILEQYRCKALELENKRLVSVNAEILSQKEKLNKKAEDLSS